MRKYLSIILAIPLLWGSSCDQEVPVVSQTTSQSKITLTDIEHDPIAKSLLANIQNRAANGRVSSIEVTDAFFKYSDPDSGVLNYTFRLPDNSPDYFENLVLSQYEDGFYGFIYRYIPDGEYISDEPFKGVLQLYNLDNELIQEFSIPYIQDSIAASGRVQLMNQCVQSIEQSCVTTYEVQTVTDYPCHCQYDRKVETGTICTFTINTGWCDDMSGSINQAGGGGTYIGAGGAIPHSGGPGGSATKLPPVKKPIVMIADDDITFNNVKSPCLVNVIKNLMKEGFRNRINRSAKYWFIDAEQAQNLNFKEVSTIFNNENEPLQAQTSSAYSNPDKTQGIDIILNSSTLPGTSELFQIVAIYHEVLHAILNMNTIYRELSPKEKHEFMASPDRTQFMIDAVTEIYNRPLTSEEGQHVAALWLYNFSDAIATNNFRDSMYKWGLFNDSIFRTGEQEEKVIKVIANGETKIKSIGGPNCNNE